MTNPVKMEPELEEDSSSAPVEKSKTRIDSLLDKMDEGIRIESDFPIDPVDLSSSPPSTEASNRESTGLLDPYKYTPLQHTDSIRLLTLHSSEESTAIEIGLAEVRLTDAPQYEALSYTWATESGDDRRCRAIKCNRSRVNITKNCERALCELRYHDKDRLLWVDAICIDQENDQERGHQVGIMKRIYRAANLVLIWLGKAPKEIDEETGLRISDLYLRHVTRMSAEMQELERNNQDPRSSKLFQKLLKDLEVMRQEDDKSALLRGLLYVHSRPWWGRVWVLQEAAAASTSAILLCSQQTARYFDVLYPYYILRTEKKSFIWLDTLLGVSRNHLSTLLRICALDHDQSWGIMRVLEHARHLKTSDPRDRIFGLLGLTTALADILPAADYSKTPSEIFVKVAKSFISHMQSLHILTAIHDENSALDQPSWAPDWSRPPLCPSILTYLGYNAARGSVATYNFSGTQELQLHGKEVDSVRKLSFWCPVSTSWYTRPDTTGGYGASFKSSCSLGMSIKEYPAGGTIQDSLWRTLCWNTDKNGIYPAPSENECYFKEWYELLTSQANPNFPRGNKFIGSVRLQKSPLCITNIGLMGSVPCPTKIGDRIVVLSGSNVPFVLRPVENHFRLIGPCYVHGIMDGEAWLEDDNELQWFSIR